MTKIYEYADYRNRNRVFKDRLDAGRLLGEMLFPDYGGLNDLIVLGIPMGGVPVALEIVKTLQCPMDLLVVRKIQIPGNTEAGFGAMTQEGDVFLNEPLLARLSLNEAQIAQQADQVRCELIARNQSLRGAKPFPELDGKTVILVDDGLASGFTMKASIYMANKRRAAKTVVAVPTAPQRTIDALHDAVDAVFCPNIRETAFFAVAEAYEHWFDLTDEQVKSMLGSQQSQD